MHNIINNHYFNLIKSVWHYGGTWKKHIVSYYILLSIAQILLEFSSYAFGKAVDELQNIKYIKYENHKYNIYDNKIIFWLLIGVFIIFIFWFFQWPGRIMERNIALKIQQEFRLNCYSKLIKLPLKWHQDQHSGDIITRINRSSKTIHHFAENQFEYLQNIVKFLTAIIFLFWISFPVGIASLILSSSVIGIVIFFDKKLIHLYKKENEIENQVNIILLDYITNMTSILTLKLGKLTQENLSKFMSYIWNFFKKEVILNEAKWFCVVVLFYLCQTMILIWYIFHHLNTTHNVMLGSVVMIFRYQWELNEVFKDLSVNYSEIVRMNTDIQSVEPILYNLEQSSSHIQDNYKINHNWHKIEILNLEWKAMREAIVINYKFIEKIKLKITRGEKIAVIGLSGCGKSTLLNLMAGLYPSSKATIKIDKVPFNSLSSMQEIAILIPQNPEIFKGTLRFNLTFGLHLDVKQINHILDITNFKEVVDALPKGLDTDIREKGLNLSGGQKQRLALARGLLATKKNSIILLDEPTSNLDLLTEQKIFHNIINEFHNTTMIVSLHGLHLLPSFDSVIMLKNGKIIAAGKTNILLNNQGPIYNLWNNYKLTHST